MILLFFEICKKDFVVMVFIMLRDFILENFWFYVRGGGGVGFIFIFFSSRYFFLIYILNIDLLLGYFFFFSFYGSR